MEQGFSAVLVQYLRRNDFARKAVLAVLSAVGFIPSLFLYFAGVRFLRITAIGRIGHLAMEPDIFVRERILGLNKCRYGVIVSPPGTAANDCLLEYWRRYIIVVRSPFWARILVCVNRFPYLRYDVSQAAINETAPYLALQRAWGVRPALLELTEEHRRAGRAWLADMGVPADAEIICFHSREAGYSPSDDAMHEFRNCNIENYFPAVAELTGRGYWCIRMGDSTTRPIKPMNRVIDYAHFVPKADWMDVFLCASCKFFLGSSSGLLFLANVFGRPSGSANHAPLSTVLSFGANDVAIPKLIWSEKESRYLTFNEVFGSEIANFRFTQLYREHGIKVVENTAEDIRDLALEMLERVQGVARYGEEDEDLQRRFKALMRPGHFSYGGVTRVGRDFLRKYAHLLT